MLPVLPFFKARLSDLHVAAVFLTRLPLPHLPQTPPPLARVLWAFPLVGAGLGVLGGGLLLGLSLAGVPPLVAAFLTLAALVLLTGGLHEDGLADVADGFGGGRGDKARTLEILRDSRIGSYGVVALVLALGLKAAALSAFADPWQGAAALSAALVLGRAVVPPLLLGSRPARQDGLGASAGRPSPAAVAFAVGGAVAVAAVILLSPLGLGGSVVAAAVAALAVIALAHRPIAGHTGEVRGAAILGAETAVLVGLSTLAGAGLW